MMIDDTESAGATLLESHESGSIGSTPLRFIDGYLPYLLAQASSRISREFHVEVESAGLSITEWRVLASLIGSSGESIGTLSHLVMTKQPTLSKVVQRMERDGLVIRCGSVRDRRQTVVQIAHRGESISRGLLVRAMQHQMAVLEPFGRENAEMLIRMLGQLLTVHSSEDLQP